MITEDYVSFETAKLLKGKGFDGWCDHFYDFYPETGEVHICGCDEHNNSRYEDEYSMPTLQMAMKWLREVHHIHTEICLYKTSESDVEPKKSRKSPYYTFGIWDTVTGDNIDKRLTNDFIGDSYKEACEEAIKYCLENLAKV
jgi:hypothetical protein